MTTMKENFNIVLCGFMGCGKTTVGQHLSAITRRKFIDTDEYIEKKASLTVSDIFSTYGEAYFRELEKTCLTEITQNFNSIIATGGGTVIDKDNVSSLKSTGKIFFLDAPFEEIFSRISNSNRPLVKTLSKDELKNLFEARRGIYLNCADFVLDAHRFHKEICDVILKSKDTRHLTLPN